MTYVPLGIRTEHSFFDGLCRVQTLVERARALRFDALGVADLHGTLALPRVALAARDAGLHPLLGTRLRLLAELPAARPWGRGQPEILLFAADLSGYGNLLRLVSLANLERGHDEAGVTLEDLENAHTGLVVVDGGLDGPIGHAFLQERPAQARRLAARLREVLGSDNFFMQIQRHGERDETAVEPFVLHLARTLNVPVVAVNDTRYLDPEEARHYEVLRCFATGRTLSDPARPQLRQRQHLRSQAEMRHLFRDLPEALANTRLIAERCQVDLRAGTPRLPEIATASGRHPALELRRQCEIGACRRYGVDRYQDVPVTARDRIVHELEIIEEKKLASCFLLVQDVAHRAKEEGISRGPGRGSLTGSLVAYVLDVSQIDPLAHGLLFERFLSPSRTTIPEFELEVEHRRREALLHYVRHQCGRDRVTQLGVVERLSARGAAHIAATVLGADTETQLALARALRLSNAGADAAPPTATDRLAAWSDPRLRAHLEIATRLEGLAQRLVPSPSGLLIGPSALVDWVALERTACGATVAQATSEDAELLGFMRLHIYGSRHISLQAEALRHRQQQTGATFDLESIGLDDEPTYRLLARGATHGVFQLEGTRLQQALRQVQPSRFADLVAVLSFERGWQRDRMSASLARTRPAAASATSPAVLARLLADTHGHLLFEEQLMRTAMEMASYDADAADNLREAIARRQWRALAVHRCRFLRATVEAGLALKAAEELFTCLVATAGTLTCQAQATAQALVAYRSAYLAAHQPLEFFTAALNHSLGQPERSGAILREAVERGVRLLNVDVHRSGVFCTIEGQAIRLGLTAVRHIGEGLASRIEAERRQSGPFRSLRDFRVRLPELPQRVLQSLVAAGALEPLGVERGGPAGAGETRGHRRGRTAVAQLELPFACGAPRAPGPMRSPHPKASAHRGGGGAERRVARRASGAARRVGRDQAGPRLWIVGRIQARGNVDPA